MIKHKRLIVCSLLLGGLTVVIGLIPHFYPLVSQKQTLLPTQPVQVAPLPEPLDIAHLLADTNTERLRAGIAPLTEDVRLDASAASKCSDMITYNYWSHDNPNGTTWESFVAAIPYNTAGENLARGYDTPEAVTAGWMASPGHRENLLAAKYSTVGYAICDYPTHRHIIVQHFIGL